MAASQPRYTSSPPSNEAFLSSVRALGATEDGGWWHLDREGRRFSLRWTSPQKNTPPAVEITTKAGPLAQPQESLEASSTATAPKEMGPFRSAPSPRIPSPAPLKLRLETGVDRAGKFLRINREMQTGDAAFDERVYVESSAADAVVLAALADPALRTNAVKCLEQGATAITLQREGDLHVARPLPHAELVAHAQLVPLIDALGAAAEAIPPLVATPKVRTFAGVFTLVVVLAALLSWPLFYVCDGLWEPLQSDIYASSVAGGILLWIFSLPILVLILRGRSESLRDVVFCALALAFALPLGGTDLMLTLNGLLDTSAPVPHATIATHMRQTSGKHTSYFVTVPSWHPGEAEIEITISSSVFFRLAVAMDITVTTSPGFLGWERLLEIRPTSEPRTSN